MRVAVQKIEGVEAVTVSLEQGLAEVRFRPEHRATLRQLQEAIRHNGFTPKAAEIQVRGTVVTGGGVGLEVPGESVPYRLILPAEAPALAQRLVELPAGQGVVIEGTVAEPVPASGPVTVTVARVRTGPRP